ncbi:MAG: transporter [Bryobacteraceae bacterium]|jgi:hypothetical protein
MLLPTGCFAADEVSAEQEMSTDRPDFTESTDIVKVGVTQVETGFVADNHALAGASVRTWTAPSTLIRTGVTSWLELRADTGGFQHERDVVNHSAATPHAGFSDIQIEAKFLLARERGLLPALAVITILTIPTGTAGFSENGYNPELELCWSKSLRWGFDAGGNLNVSWNRGDPANSLGQAQSLSVGHRLSAHLRGYWEVYRVAPIPGDEAAHWIANTGISRMLGRNAQVDVEAGHSLLARTPTWFLGAGFSVRVPASGFLRHH